MLVIMGKYKLLVIMETLIKLLNSQKFCSTAENVVILKNTKETRLKLHGSILLSLMGKAFCNTILRKNKGND